jgi:hypothetical protein
LHVEQIKWLWCVRKQRNNQEPSDSQDRFYDCHNERTKFFSVVQWYLIFQRQRHEPTREEADQALVVARDLYEAILTRIPPEE